MFNNAFMMTDIVLMCSTFVDTWSDGVKTKSIGYLLI